MTKKPTRKPRKGRKKPGPKETRVSIDPANVKGVIARMLTTPKVTK